MLLALLALARPVLGQDGAPSSSSEDWVEVVGMVVDQTTQDPVPLARVVFIRVGAAPSDEPAWTGVSDADGGFDTGALELGGYEIELSAMSFAEVSHVEVFPEAGIVDLRVEIAPVDYALDPIVVTARRATRLERAGFYDRERRGLGYFVDHAEIEARRALNVSDLFRTIPGARVGGGGIGSGGFVGLRGGCVPQVVMDGAVMAGAVPLDALLRPSDIEAIEVYHGTTAPMPYSSRSTCGTIMVWTRNPPEPTGHSISLGKFFAIIGFATIAVVATGN